MARCLVLIGSLLLGQVAAGDDKDLKAEVGRLVRQLDAPQLAQREAAEAELLRRGPAVLGVLPPDTDRESAEVQQRLGRIRQKLQHAAADAVISASTITVHAVGTRMSKVLSSEDKERLLTVTVEAAWEPRLQVISLMQRMADVRAVDERGDVLPVADADAQPDFSVGGAASAVKFDVPLRLPSRAVKQIASLKGKLLATIPGKVETFRFDKLADAKNRQQRIAGVTVTLDQVRKTSKAATSGRPHPGPLPKGEGTQWEVGVRVRFDDAGDALASHRQWIFSNPAYLEGPDRKPIAYDTFETTAQSQNELGIAYLFNTDRLLDELTFIYKTPGTIVSAEFPYELKSISLP
jgi:hypothetical protein